jgi:hypothetical protein
MQQEDETTSDGKRLECVGTVEHGTVNQTMRVGDPLGPVLPPPPQHHHQKKHALQI